MAAAAKHRIELLELPNRSWRILSRTKPHQRCEAPLMESAWSDKIRQQSKIFFSHKRYKNAWPQHFAWLKTLQEKANSSSKLKEAINYSMNQEVYLRRFLEDPLLPLDNNDAERSIKSFCVGKHSWHIIDSPKGANASALLYSIAESAKANSLKPYEYFCYLLTELVRYPRNDVPAEVLKSLMPWSGELPDHCRKTKSR